jgi:hypothetical protein
VISFTPLPLYPWRHVPAIKYRGLGGHQSRPGGYAEEKYGLPLMDIELLILLIPVRSLVTIPTGLFSLLESDVKQRNDN